MSSAPQMQVQPRVTTQHGKLPRGLTATTRSRLFEGRFGRLFRELPPGKYGATEDVCRDELTRLGALMTADPDAPFDGTDPEESGIPALYTYFGQFIDHDITFDPESELVKHRDPDGLTDFRSPTFDLDNVYGRGPGDQPYFYQDGTKFLLGDPLANGAPDLPRNSATPARAIIGDPRNDENSIISQLQGLFLRFHNRFVDDHPGLEFHDVQQLVRFHYQYLVLNDFLPRIISATVLDDLRTDGNYDSDKLKFYRPKNDAFMPVEFSVAAYRFGHSMVRPGYRLNDATLLPIFPGSSGDGLTGFRAMNKAFGIDWGRFIDIDRRPRGDDNSDNPDSKKRLQLAYRIDTSLNGFLGNLPKSVADTPPPSLAGRNLLRSLQLGLPTGQSVAKRMHVRVLEDEEIVLGKAVDTPEKGDIRGTMKDFPAFRGNCPLWTYILAEAAQHQVSVAAPDKDNTPVTTPQLGPVGGRIVAEVFLGMMFKDNQSVVNLEPGWVPWIQTDGDFRLKDLVNYALGN